MERRGNNGFFVTDTLLPGSKGQDNYENIKATYERKSWNLSEKIILPEDNKDIYAYLPYKEGMMLDSMDIETGMSTVPLWGKAKHCVNKEDPIALIDLNTPMTFVKIRIRKVNFPGEKILQSVRIYNETEGLPVKGKMDMLSGKVKAFEFNELISENIQAKINDIYTDAASASFLTLPSSGERERRNYDRDHCRWENIYSETECKCGSLGKRNGKRDSRYFQWKDFERRKRIYQRMDKKFHPYRSGMVAEEFCI